ncbi:MAG: hypothetical protein JO157_16140 [Acetobacteraceae bacterium]|nr:hypothetical protein [Acetobacteraceae bacterium]
MLADLARAIEEERGSTVLILACSNLELDLIGDLYEVLRGQGHRERLDLVFWCRGGEVVAARRLALLLHRFADDLTFVVPYHCQSAGTLATLCAHRIVAGPAAMFSPIDPLLAAGGEGGGGAVSSQDVRLFGAMAQAWFGVDEAEAKAQALAALGGAIFPTTLTSFYRSTLEMEEIAKELLALRSRTLPQAQWSEIVQRLVFGYHSHGFSLTGEDLAALGLPIEPAPRVEDLAWAIAQILRKSVGGGVRASVDAPWFDVLIGTRDGARRRRRHPEGLEPIWERFDG